LANAANGYCFDFYSDQYLVWAAYRSEHIGGSERLYDARGLQSDNKEQLELVKQPNDL